MPATPAVVQCPDGTPPPCAPRPARPQTPTVAVLYFDNLSRDSGDAYLAEGLTEQTIAQLGGVERLTVSSRFAVRRFRGGAMQDPAAVGRALNATYLVTGTVQRAGPRLRVGVELLRAASGVRVWGEQYDRTETDLLRLQDDIATSVATGVVGRLLPGERRGLAARPTRNPAAWDHFLRGNFHLARRDAANMLLALRSYQAAIAADPGFTDAVARVAYVHALALDNEADIGLPRDSLVARGLEYAERAVRLDSLSSDAWLASAYIRMGRDPYTFEGARERFERAIRLNPRSAEARHQYGSFLHYLGDTARFVAENRRALEIEPGRAITWFQLSEVLVQQRRPAEALAHADSALAADPTFALARIHAFFASLAFDTARARAEVRGMLASSTLNQYGHVFELMLAAVGGDHGARQALLAALRGLPTRPTQPGTVISDGFGALILAMAGERQAALDALHRARPRGVRLHDIMRYPGFDVIRNEPAFQRLWNETRAPGVTW